MDEVEDGAAEPWASARQKIAQRYLQLLTESGSPLANMDSAVLTQLVAQVMGICDATAVRLGLEQATVGRPEAKQLSGQIGRDRAGAGVHPVHSLRAAAIIFQAALPVLSLRVGTRNDPAAERSTAIALNAEIMERMAFAASPYAELLLETVHRHNRDERRRVSRELHDRAGQDVVLALQNLELYRHYEQHQDPRAPVKLHEAERAMREALQAIRDLSAEVRESVAEAGVDRAIRSLLSRMPDGIHTELAAAGDVDSLPLPYADEIFLIIREAVANAVSHGRPNRVEVRLRVQNGIAYADVRDDGLGFDVAEVEHGTGLDSMRERAQLLGGSLTLQSEPGHGCKVALAVPVIDTRAG